MTPALRELLVVALFIGSPNLATGRGANHGRAPMRRPYHYRRPNPDRRRALELLAGSRYGYTKAILRAHGFSIDIMVELVKAGLATTKRERMVADGRQTGVVRVRITEAGRQALARMSK
jgi:hypothetical protein